MTTLPYTIVDVFAPQRYQGNPLAVFDARDPAAQALLTTELMQTIARELGFQEITFVMGGSPGAGFAVRIFTPEYEVPFAGHPTLGTAWVLANRLVGTGRAPLTLQLGVGPVPVQWIGDTPWLTAAQPTFGSSYDRAELAELLQLPPDALDDRLPIERVSTGLLYVIIPIRTLAAMRAIRIDVSALEAWLLRHGLHKTNSPEGLHTSLYPVCSETYDPAHGLNARMFCFEQGHVAEDYATGSAGSCLLAYLLKNRVLGDGTVRLRVEQGYEAGRPSLLELDGSLTANGEYRLQIGGTVQYVAAGEWALDA